jgi:hypothetical protein
MSTITLRRWAGLRHATIEKAMRGGDSAGYVYWCVYHVPGEPGCWDEAHGPLRRNPMDAMEAAKALAGAIRKVTP